MLSFAEARRPGGSPIRLKTAIFPSVAAAVIALGMAGPAQAVIFDPSLTITDSDNLTAPFGTLSLTARENGVPEPPTLAMLGLGIAALGLCRTRRPRLAVHKTTNHA